MLRIVELGNAMAHYDIHVIPQGELWAVIREGDDSPVSLHATETEAEHAGRQLAADGAVAFKLHRREGANDHYNNDPRS